MMYVLNECRVMCTAFMLFVESMWLLPDDNMAC
jgi:hypothetical protein